MSFLQPSPPPFDLQEWRAKPYLGRIKANCQDWAVNGFGTPGVVYVLYVVKLIVFLVGAFFLISITTPGIGGLGDIGDWWMRPIVFQKLAVWTLVWEILGLGSGSMQLAARYGPVIGGVLYWLRPGTVRLPPWPDRIPMTRGNRRTIGDVALYAGVLAAGVYLLVSNGEAVGGALGGRLQPAAIAVLLGVWVLLGLRDKVSFLAARPEIYGFVLVVSLFPVHNLIVAWQFIFLFIWWGAASSKLNRHFPFVISVMVSNTPWNRSPKLKAKLYKDYPEDLRPGHRAAFGAHLGTAVEFGVPLVLILSSGGTIGTLAVIAMLTFHAHILSTFALGVPQEWNLFMLFGILFLFGHYGDVPLSMLDNPLLIVLGAEVKFDERACMVARITVEQLSKVYGREIADYFMEKVLAFRSMHSHGRALNALLARAVDDVDAYNVRDGEVISGLIAGWNFGDGHFHHRQLLDAVQERCGFAEGELRVVMLESQPAHVQRQRYRIHDAATGLIEEGWVNVADMVARGPWLEESFDFPVEGVQGPGRAPGPAAIA